MYEMTPEHLKIIGILVGTAVLIRVLTPVGNWLARRKLERWARDERVELLAFKMAPGWRGPRAWFRDSENQEDYFVVVDDRHGQRRTGWVLYTWPWHSLGPAKVEVRWDEVAQDVEIP